MGHAHSKQRAEVERIIKEVRDIENYIKRNSDEFDDECRDNLHKRLVDYSTSLQDVFESAKKRNSRECREATKYINKVIESLYLQRPLDSGAVETNSIIRVSPRDHRLMGSSENIDRLPKQTKPKRDLLSHEKYRIPSLDEIRDKTSSLKLDIDTSIKNDDINQLLVQQKIVQILATDLEMISFEPHSPLQEAKEILEKELSLMFRKIERAKKKNHDSVQLKHQREMRESVGELTRINIRIDQIMSSCHGLVKEKKFADLIKARDEVMDSRLKVETMVSKNEEVIRMKSDITGKIEKLFKYLNTEVGNYTSTTSAINTPNVQHKSEDTISREIADITGISSNIDQCISRAHILVKQKSYSDLLELKNQVLNDKDKLQKDESGESNVILARSELEKKINDTLDYLNKQIENSGIGKKQRKTEDNLERAEVLIKDCRGDIMKFDQNTSRTEYETYNKHLDGLENFLNKISLNETSIIKKKADCIKSLTECRQLFRDKYQQSIRTTPNSQRSTIDEYFDEQGSSERGSRKKESKKDDSSSKSIEELGDEEITLRKKLPPQSSKNDLTEVRNIDGLYSYWRDLQQNLPSYNCSFDELKQIIVLLNDLEEQIKRKRLKIENFLKEKQNMSFYEIEAQMIAKENTTRYEKNKQIIDQIDSNAVKAHVKIYKLNDTKHLIIDDDEIIQNIDEINEGAKHIRKQTPERVFLPSDGSTTSSLEPEKTKQEEEQSQNVKATHEITSKSSKLSITDSSLERKTEMTKKFHETAKNLKSPDKTNRLEYIAQVHNIANSVAYLKEKAMRFSGTKQTPKYLEIKKKLDSYRKTLNILMSYKNESITLSCNRVLTDIDEVAEILNVNTEKDDAAIAKLTGAKTNTIESIFAEIMDMKSRLDDIAKTIQNFEDAVENEIYLSIKDELIRNINVLTDMKVSAHYEVIVKSKDEVMRQIQDNLYNLDMKLQENKVKHRHQLLEKNNGEQKLVVDFQKIKDKVNRFSGTYKNILYNEIEKSIDNFLTSAKNTTSDRIFLENLNEDAVKYLKILEGKATKENDDTSPKLDAAVIQDDKNNTSTDVAIQLSRMRQNFKDIRDEVNSKEPATLEVNRKLDHRINLNMLELSLINIGINEPFYYDKEQLKQDFLKLSAIIKDNITALESDRIPADGQSSSQHTTLEIDKYNVEKHLDNIRTHLDILRSKIDEFAGEKNSISFFNIDEGLTRLSMNVDKCSTKRGSDLHRKKQRLLGDIYECYETLENKAQSYEILQNVEKKVDEVKYRIDNFHELSDGDYNALYKELIDLNMILKDLSVSDNLTDKKMACQTNIKQCMIAIENRDINESDREYESDNDGTFV